MSHCHHRTAFTLVEILIVVIILGILAAIVLPKFSTATATARASMLADNLRIFRTQVAVYEGQHLSQAPGYPSGGGTPTEADFVAQMTQSSRDDGQTAAVGTDGYKHGPYMREIPPNPVNGKKNVLILDDSGTIPASASDQYGWIYQPSTMIVKADCVGQDDTGKAYIDY
jgi:general secretion pathway protein G